MSAQGSVGFRWGTITGPYANFSQVETQKFDPHWFYCLQWGCNNLFCQECMFGPLIDRHPDTVLTTMTYCQQVMHQQGSPYCILTADMQLFNMASQIRWCDIDTWQTIVLHPGGMYTSMSFLGVIGHLMKGGGLEEILGVAFSGINSMLNGKAWPRAMQGFRMVTTALLQQCILAGTTEVANIEEELEMARNTQPT